LDFLKGDFPDSKANAIAPARIHPPLLDTLTIKGRKGKGKKIIKKGGSGI